MLFHGTPNKIVVPEYGKGEENTIMERYVG